MLNLAEYRNRSAALADFLPWAALVGGRRRPEQGRQVPAHGALPRPGPRYRDAGRTGGLTARLNNALRRLGSGWAIFVEAQRIAAQTYPALDLSRSRVGAGGLECQDAFEEAGAHFESRYYLTFVWLPPAEDASRVEGWLYEGRAQTRRRSLGAAARFC